MTLKLDNIKAICQEALVNTEVVTETLCDNIQDYYLLGRVELAKEILKELKSIGRKEVKK